MPNAQQRHEAQMARANTINNRMPPFPCTVLLFSRSEQVTGHKVFRFSDQKSFDHCRALTVAMVRVLLHPEDLQDVPMPTLLALYDNLAKLPGSDLPSPREIPREVLQNLIFGAVHGAATPYEETPMGTSSTPDAGTPATGTTSTDAKAAEKAAAKAAKDAEKAAAKQAAAEKRANGVIGQIKKALDTNEGTTANEILDKLVAAFPDRTREGMSSTVKIQFSRLAKSTGRTIHNANIEGRGRVYKFADKGPVPGKVVEVAPTPAAPAAQGDNTVATSANASTGAVGSATPTTPQATPATATAPAAAAKKAKAK